MGVQTRGSARPWSNVLAPTPHWLLAPLLGYYTYKACMASAGLCVGGTARTVTLPQIWTERPTSTLGGRGQGENCRGWSAKWQKRRTPPHGAQAFPAVQQQGSCEEQRRKSCLVTERHLPTPLSCTSCFCCLSLRSCFKYQSLFSGRSPRSPRAAADSDSYKTAASSCSRARSILDKAEDAGEKKKERTRLPLPCRLPVPSPSLGESVLEEGTQVLGIYGAQQKVSGPRAGSQSSSSLLWLIISQISLSLSL